MATGSVRNPETLRRGIERWLSDRFPGRGELELESFERASIGFSNETLIVAARWAGEGPESRERFVVRIPALEATHPACDLGVEAAVQGALARAGLPVPGPIAFEPSSAYLGAEFLVMPFVDGQVGPQTPAIDPWLLGLAPERQRVVAEGFVDFLADLHGVDPAATGVRERLHGGGDLRDEVEWWRRYVAWACGDDPVPTVVTELLGWCADHAPAVDLPVSLLWGDARVGNAIFDADEALVAALDWDMAFAGPAEHDLGWYLGLDALTTALLGRGVPGFPDREQLVARYEARLGRTLAPLPWFEIFALVRSIAVALRLYVLSSRSGGAPVMPAPVDNPVVAHAQELIDGWSTGT